MRNTMNKPFSILNTDWYLPNPSADTLQRLGFHRDSRFEGGVMTLQVPLYPSLYAVIAVDMETAEVRVNVYQNSGGLYAPFYQRYGAYNELVGNIDRLLLEKLERIGIMNKSENEEALSWTE